MTDTMRGDVGAAVAGGPVVLKVGGSVLADGGMPQALVDAVSRLQRRGIPVVIVHGGGDHVTEVLSRLGLETEFVDGLRVTSPEVMEVVEMVLSGRVNKSVVSAFQEGGIQAVGISGKDGRTLHAVPHASSDRLGMVGTVDSSDTRLVRRLMEDGFVPVVCSVAGGDGGATYNVNADEAAAALAGSLGAERLLLLTDVPGVLRGPEGARERVEELSVTEARELLENGDASGGMRPKIRACLQALEGGVHSAHVMGVGEADAIPDLVLGTARPGTAIVGHHRTASDAGARTRDVTERAARYLLGTYRPTRIAFHGGHGSRLWGLDGREYLDFIAGIAVSSLGHAHPALVDAVSGQVSRYVHVSNLYEIPEQVDAAQLLVEASGLDRAFFCNSGAEAVEGVIKVARKWGGATRGDACREIVVMEGAFHGRTLGALSATWNPRYRDAFQPLTPGFVRVPFNDLDAVVGAVGPDTCAVLLEPIQGESGVIPADAQYLRGLRDLTREREVLLALDEVQTGVGRTGRMFAFEHYGVKPDLMALAKGLGGGVPIGAVLAVEEVASCMEPGDHATTFGGNALASAAAVAVLRTLLDDGGLAHAARMGDYLREKLEALVGSVAGVEGVRGKGLLLGLALEGGARNVASRLAEAGLLVNAIGERTLRIAPPLVVTPEEIDQAVAILARTLSEEPA